MNRRGTRTDHVTFLYLLNVSSTSGSQGDKGTRKEGCIIQVFKRSLGFVGSKMVADFKLITKTRVICGPPEPGLTYRSLPPLKPDWLPPLEQMVSLCPAETRLATAFGTDDQWGCGDLTQRQKSLSHSSVSSWSSSQCNKPVGHMTE